MPTKKLLPRSFFASPEAYGDYLRRTLGPEARYFMEDQNPFSGAFSTLQKSEIPIKQRPKVRTAQTVVGMSTKPREIPLGKYETLGDWLWDREWKQRQKSRKSWQSAGKAHGMPAGFDPLDVRTQMRLTEEAIKRNKSYGGRAVNALEFDLKRYQDLLDVGQKKLPLEWAGYYGLKSEGQGALGIPSGFDDAFEGYTPGWGKPSMESANQQVRASIEAIESSNLSDVEKTVKINKMLADTQSAYFDKTAEEASGVFRYEKSRGKQLDKWWGRYDKSRVPFYEDISLRSYKPAIGDEGFLKRIGIDLENMKDLTTGEPLKLKDIKNRIAEAEKSIYFNGEKAIGMTRMPLQQGDLFMGRPTESGSKLYISPTAQRAMAREQYGQSKVLRDATTGELIPLGTKVIGTDILKSSAVTKAEYLESVRKLYFDALKSGAVADIQKYRAIISDATLDLRAFNPLVSNKDIKVHKRVKEIRQMVRQDRNIGNAIKTARGSKRVTYRGYEAVRDIVERSEVGTKFVVGAKNSKIRAIVAEMTSLSDVSLLTVGNRVRTFGEQMNRTMKIDQRIASMPDLFEASLIREPFVKGAEVHPYTLKVMGGKGVYLGNVSAEIERTFGIAAGSEVARGYVGQAFVRPYITEWKSTTNKWGKKKWTPVYKLGIWRTAEEAYETVVDGTSRFTIPVRASRLAKANTVTAHWKVQEQISSMMKMVGDDWVTPGIDKLMSAKYPAVSVSSLSAAEAEAWRSGVGIPRERTAAKRGHGRAMMVGAAVTAGALMLWGASRLRNTAPMTEREVAGNLYGRVEPVPPQSGRVYTPATRITPSNTGYSTNIEMEVQDDGSTVDHRGMAASMSAISRSALGASSANTSLHVIDDSEGMDRESVRRKLNQQLSL